MKKVILLLLLVLFASSVYGALSDGLRAGYNFDDANISSNTLYDLTPNNYDMTMANHASTGGVIGEARNFTGTGSGATISSNWALTNANTNWSISYWINTRTNDAVKYVLSFGCDYDAKSYFLPTPTFRPIVLYDGATAQYNEYTNIPLKTWTHVAIVRNNANTSGELKTWVNGVEVDSDDLSITVRSLSEATCSIMRSVTGDNLAGAMDDLYIWNSRSLSYDEIQTLYNEGNGCTYPFTDCGEVPPTPTISINTDMNNTNPYKEINLSIKFNGTLSDTTTNLYSCSLWKNNVLINQSLNINMTKDNYFYLDTTFLDESWILNINCSNAEAQDNTSNYIYGFDTFLKSSAVYLIEDNGILNNLKEEITMLPLVFLYIFFLIYGYWLVKTANFWIGLVFLIGTLVFDVYFGLYYISAYLGIGVMFLVIGLGKVPMFLFVKAYKR